MYIKLSGFLLTWCARFAFCGWIYRRQKVHLTHQFDSNNGALPPSLPPPSTIAILTKTYIIEVTLVTAQQQYTYIYIFVYIFALQKNDT